MGQRIMALELTGERVRAALADRTWNALELIGAWEQERRQDEADLVPANAARTRSPVNSSAMIRCPMPTPEAPP